MPILINHLRYVTFITNHYKRSENPSYLPGKRALWLDNRINNYEDCELTGSPPQVTYAKNHAALAEPPQPL